MILVIVTSKGDVIGDHISAERCKTSTKLHVCVLYLQFAVLRKKYVPAYVQCLHDNKLGGNAEIEAMDAQLPEHTILVFRRLAHAKVTCWHPSRRT